MRGLLALGLVAWPALAGADPVDDLTDALRLSDLAVMVHDEGVEDSLTLFDQTPSGHVPDLALTQVDALFDPALIEAEMRQALARDLTEEQMAEAVAFYASKPGQAMTTLELVARSAMADPEVETIARSEWADRQDEDSELIRQIRRFAEVNSLVFFNASSTMTARVQYLRGLAEGSGTAQDDGEIMSGVMATADSIRAETESWLMGYLLLAYGPADPADLRAYVAFSETPAGQAVNAAIFKGFSDTYGRISHGLGLIAGRAALAEDL